MRTTSHSLKGHEGTPAHFYIFFQQLSLTKLSLTVYLMIQLQRKSQHSFGFKPRDLGYCRGLFLLN